jgi:hypothetical protein
MRWVIIALQIHFPVQDAREREQQNPHSGGKEVESRIPAIGGFGGALIVWATTEVSGKGKSPGNWGSSGLLNQG